MPLLSVKLTEAAMADLKREAQITGTSLSELVRQKLDTVPQSDDRLDSLERRLSRLEEMAGL